MMNNIPEAEVPFGDLPEGIETAFFITVFDPLKQVGIARNSGKPIQNRSKRIWGWFPTFEAAYEIVQGNISDIHEHSYEYVLIEEVPFGISQYGTRCWWWKWDVVEDCWVKSSRPTDFLRVCGLSLG